MYYNFKSSTDQKFLLEKQINNTLLLNIEVNKKLDSKIIYKTILKRIKNVLNDKSHVLRARLIILPNYQYYYDDLNVFQLRYADKQFILSGSGKLPTDSKAWKSMKFDLIRRFP